MTQVTLHLCINPDELSIVCTRDRRVEPKSRDKTLTFNSLTSCLYAGTDPRPQIQTTVPSEFQRPKIGLAFGGGFARGIAHVGALKVLEEEGIPIDYVSGTSVGAIIAAAYCSGVSAKESPRSLFWFASSTSPAGHFLATASATMTGSMA